MQFRKLKILVVAFDVLNPMSIGWIHGFQRLGHTVSVIVTKDSDLTNEHLTKLGFYNQEFPNTPIFQYNSSKYCRKEILASLNQEPDLLFFWEGIGIIKQVRNFTSIFSKSKTVFCVCTHPNCASVWRERLTNFQYRKISSLIDGYIFYSQEQQKLFTKNVPQATCKVSTVMMDPFFEKAFASAANGDLRVPVLKRYDDNPHVIFTGNARHLWDKARGHRGKDSLGPFFQRLCTRGIHVFVHEAADTRNIPNLHVFPTFYNPDLAEGRFSQYISQFDAHLVIYNTHTATEKRRASTGLATRFAYAITATSPIAVSEISTFVREIWNDEPFGFTFHDIDDLVNSLYDSQKLSLLRSNMKKFHRQFSFESQASSLNSFLETVIAN